MPVIRQRQCLAYTPIMTGVAVKGCIQVMYWPIQHDDGDSDCNGEHTHQRTGLHSMIMMTAIAMLNVCINVLAYTSW